MSLTSLVAMPDVVAKIKPLRPKVQKHGVSLKVEPRSKRYALIGTAFDYLLRFELQRRVPDVVVKRWVAEEAPDIIHPEYGSTVDPLDLLVGVPPEQYIPPSEVAERMRVLLQNAHSAVGEYRNAARPTATQQAELAAHAIRLSKLDSVYRAEKLEPTFEEAKAEDVQELVELLAIVPYDTFVTAKTLLLNPTFGEASALVGGADADVIADDVLVDLKTTKSDTIEGKHLDQLFGYFLLARRHRSAKPTFPAIHRVGLYFSRHGHLWTQDTTVWTSHPEFAVVEQWFFKRAGEVFKHAKA